MSGITWDFCVGLAPTFETAAARFVSRFAAVMTAPRAWDFHLPPLPVAEPQRGSASFATLRRRATYGGRKGRRAARRLRAAGVAR